MKAIHKLFYAALGFFSSKKDDHPNVTLFGLGFCRSEGVDPGKLIDALKSTRTHRLIPQTGICFNVGRLMRQYDNVTKVLAELFKGWEHHNGSNSWPVPEDTMYDRWEGPNLELRVSLIDHVLNQLEAK